MSDQQTSVCPECREEVAVASGVDRRNFLRVVGGGMATLAGSSTLLSGNRSQAAPAATGSSKPAEDLIRELHGMLSDEQKKAIVLPWDYKTNPNSPPARLQTYNSAVLGKRIGQTYTKPQQELVQRILKAILSSEEAYERITRHGKWDGSGSFEGNGAVIFGDPTGDEKFAWVFAGHHLTVRCDGNSEPGAAFGGPMYYGHSAHGYSDTNVYNYQTRHVQGVFDALSEKQRTKAVVVGNPGDREAGIRFRPEGQALPGIAYAELEAPQREQVESVMRLLLDPFRKEDGDEVLQLIKTNGGMEKIHLAFYKDNGQDENQRWHFWRLEGPGFIWNYRVLPHVHCYVNIVSKA